MAIDFLAPISKAPFHNNWETFKKKKNILRPIQGGENITIMLSNVW